MRRAIAFYSLLAVSLVGVSLNLRATSLSQPAVDVNRLLGKWNSVERFEGEPRVSVSFRSNGPAIEGWAVLLGQHRKNDDRATLGLSFTNAASSGEGIQFSTILPEDEGTIGWELRLTTPATAVLTALTEDGQLIWDPIKWDMTR